MRYQLKDGTQKMTATAYMEEWLWEMVGREAEKTDRSRSEIVVECIENRYVPDAANSTGQAAD